MPSRGSFTSTSGSSADVPGNISGSDGKGVGLSESRGLQEERIERDAWKGILSTLTRMKEEKDREAREVQ